MSNEPGERECKVHYVRNELKEIFNSLIVDAKPIDIPSYKGQMYELPGGGTAGWRDVSKYGGPAIDLDIPGITFSKIHLP